MAHGTMTGADKKIRRERKLFGSLITLKMVLNPDIVETVMRD